MALVLLHFSTFLVSFGVVQSICVPTLDLKTEDAWDRRSFVGDTASHGTKVRVKSK